jgi:2-phospho-L-lactate guanylyltransferase
MKPLADAKSRLRGALPDDRRRLLSLAMLVHVLRTAGSVPGAVVETVGGDSTVQAACSRANAGYTPYSTSGLNACLRNAFRAGTAVFLPADLPLLERVDVESLIAPLADGRQVSIAPDRHNAGTNALAIRRPSTFEPMMGEGSFVRHLAALAIGGTSYAIVRSPGLALDIDVPADLDALLGRRPDWWDVAGSLVAGLT